MNALGAVAISAGVGIIFWSILYILSRDFRAFVLWNSVCPFALLLIVSGFHVRGVRLLGWMARQVGIEIMEPPEEGPE